ncbi:hypothetical protein QYE76_070761 [Lolium multiflorum]|uniref:E2 ubiquitin-conjugating enzyme n=2 Tax=Lolium TaxID=4520 RepID=A0AAD8SIT5_LOLMU|nr:hypothetical protein QYE76_070761 [Lolium multiflorum]
MDTEWWDDLAREVDGNSSDEDDGFWNYCRVSSDCRSVKFSPGSILRLPVSVRGLVVVVPFPCLPVLSSPPLLLATGHPTRSSPSLPSPLISNNASPHQDPRSPKMSSPSKRREMDLMKLMMSDYKVEMVNDGMQEFFVEFRGPNESLYQGGVWKVRVELPDAYPYRSPSIGFVNKIYHPNVDELSGSVCLDVINQTWSPMFDLVNVFEVFLPQLLLYPNPSDPLNGEAAALLMRDRPAYELKVKEFCEKYAKPEDAGIAPEDNSSDEELSEEDDDDSGDDEPIMGHPDP